MLQNNSQYYCFFIFIYYFAFTFNYTTSYRNNQIQLYFGNKKVLHVFSYNYLIKIQNPVCDMN